MITLERAKIWEKDLDKKAARIRAERVLVQIKKYNSNAKKVLELGVGIGIVLVNFSKKYEVSGLDFQKEYVKIARKLIPRAKFYVQSMDKFKINKKWDVIYSVHGCLNEIKPYKKWELTFKNVGNHLNRGGLFIFDMHTLKHIEDKKKQIVKLEKTPSGYIYDDFVVKKNKVFWEITYFKKVKDKLYKLEKDNYFGEVYKIKKVKKSLLKYFKILDIIKIENQQRALFVCRKK